MEDLVGSSICAFLTSGKIIVDSFAHGQTLRASTPINIHVDSRCKNDQDIELHFVGEHDGEYGTEYFKGSANFKVGHFDKEEVLDDNLFILIPDKKSITYSFDINKVDIVKDIEVRIKLEHSYIGDLTISLISPTGEVIILRSRKQSSEQNFEFFYNFENSDLQKLLDKKAVGEWKLKFEDNSSRDEGTLHYVEFKITGLRDIQPYLSI